MSDKGEEQGFGSLLGYLQSSLKPYAGKPMEFKRLPKDGLPKEEILSFLSGVSSREDTGWRAGRVSGAVYHGAPELVSFLHRIFRFYSQSNPLHVDIWPSLTKFEAEIVSMTGSLMHGDDSVRGSVTSGGTESILLAMKAYRDYFVKKKGITSPSIIIPVSAHAAFSKACEYFGLRPIYVSLKEDFTVDTERVKESIESGTVAIVGSAPCFPFGTYDDIKQLSEIASDKKIGMHVDACLGGFINAFAEKAGYEVPVSDFRNDGVTSISIDTHKYGFAPKGTSVILYRNSELFHEQVYAATDWQGGIYFTPTMAGSRAGFPIVAAWAVMVALGEEGYVRAAKRILDTGRYIISRAKNMNGLKILGKPFWVIAFSSEEYNPYLVMEGMSRRGWFLNGLMNPSAFHIALTMRHTSRGVKEKFITDLANSLNDVEEGRITSAPLAPIYGMASSLPKEDVKLFIKNIVEWLYS
ncbi:MAG: aspartate aminotransferase family protein [Conexivisphaerales archaeon]